MVTLTTKFKKGSGLSGTKVSHFKTTKEAKAHKRFLRGSYISSEIKSQKRRQPKRRSIFG